MIRDELERILTDTGLFNEWEIPRILQTCGSYTRGHAVIGCEMLKIELSGHDVNVIIETE